MASGLAATLIEAPLALQKTMRIPENHYQACHDSATPIEGNAAGKTVDFLDLSGENKSPRLSRAASLRGELSRWCSAASALSRVWL